MINHKEADILAYLIKLKPFNIPMVLEPQDIIDNMTEKVDKDEVLSLLTDLSGREAVNIKIINMDEIVVSTTPKAPVLIDELKEMEQTREMINTVKTTIPVVEEPTNESEKRSSFTAKRSKKPQVNTVTTKVVIDYKKIFWSAFSGALCGGGIIAIIMLIISIV